MKRIQALPAFFISCGSVAFLAASLSTQYWVVSSPRMSANIDDNVTTVYTGDINFGLFKGKKMLDHGVGKRFYDLTIACAPRKGVCMYSDQETSDKRTEQLNDNLQVEEYDEKNNSTNMVDNPHLMAFSVWTFTVVTVAVSLFFGLISAIFAVVNTVITPVEFITGFQGLYVWNSLGGISALMAVCSWAAIYHGTLQTTVMNLAEQEKKWVSKGFTSLGYSYWFVLSALFQYCLNICVIVVIIKQPFRIKQPQPIRGKNPEGSIMLY